MNLCNLCGQEHDTTGCWPKGYPAPDAHPPLAPRPIMLARFLEHHADARRTEDSFLADLLEAAADEIRRLHTEVING